MAYFWVCCAKQNSNSTKIYILEDDESCEPIEQGAGATVQQLVCCYDDAGSVIVPSMYSEETDRQ